MKKLIITAILAATVAAGATVMAQDQPEGYLGLPGDNLNLYAVMKLFQESETIEGFERSLNDENSRINNLDLNGDNLTDYIRVTDYVDGNVHNIVLQAVLDRNESQDVAVFTVQRFNDGEVQIQLTGDEALYGKNYIVEPIYDETPNPGYMGRADGRNVTVVRTTTVQVAAWPLVRFIFMPDYMVWRSSWYWGYYPVYWHPWRPFFWHYYYGYHSHWNPYYYGRFRRWETHRYSHWDDFYYHGRRVYSPNISVRINNGVYRTTYSHPEERKRGEDLYYRTYKDHGSRESVTSVNNGRRVSNSTYNGRNNNINNRRSNRTTVDNPTIHTGTIPNTGNNANTGRRSSGDKMNNKYGDKNQPNGEATNWKNRSNGNQGNTGRTNVTVPSGNNSKPESGRKIENVNSRRESSVNTNKSGRNNSGNGGSIKSNNNQKNNNSDKSDGKKGSGKESKPSRRK